MPPEPTPAEPARRSGGDASLRPVRGEELRAPTPAELLGRVALGDEDAFSHLYDDTAPLLFGLIRRVVRDVAMSEEVLQEVFVEVWRQATRFDAHRGTASSEAARRRDSEEGLLQMEQQVVDVQEEGIMRVESQRVRTAMGELTSPQAEAIRLAYFGGYSHREVAALLDIPVGTAKTRIRDGMIVLRDRLGVTS